MELLAQAPARYLEMCQGATGKQQSIKSQRRAGGDLRLTDCAFGVLPWHMGRVARVGNV
jgi:hypothetical protein